MNDTRQARADFANLRRGILRGLALSLFAVALLVAAVHHFHLN